MNSEGERGILESQSHRDLETCRERHKDPEKSTQSQRAQAWPRFPEAGRGKRQGSLLNIYGLARTPSPPLFLALHHSHSSLLKGWVPWPNMGLVGSEWSPQAVM